MQQRQIIRHIGLKITKYNRAGLQTVIVFWLQSVTKTLKTELQSVMGLKSVMDSKVIQYTKLI